MGGTSHYRWVMNLVAVSSIINEKKGLCLRDDGLEEGEEGVNQALLSGVKSR